MVGRLTFIRNGGIMEEWNDGRMSIRLNRKSLLFYCPIFQYSSIPIFRRIK
jgi:hypothetical protein